VGSLTDHLSIRP
jgi:OTU domain-containing protein 6